jgi:hypothetical protein
VKAAQALLLEALEREGEAQRLLLAGDAEAAAPTFREVASLYRRSWEEAHSGAFGRLAGMIKAAILAGDGEEEAEFVRGEIGSADSPSSAYPLALAALVAGDDGAATEAARSMREGGNAFALAAEAADALAAGDATRYASAVAAIVRDFERREEHLTGVAIADTAVVFERLAEPRGIAAYPESALMPQR